MMKASPLLLVLAMAGCMPAPQTSNTPKSGASMPDSIVQPYLKIEEALAGDSIEGIRASAGEIATAATALGSPAMKIDTSALQMTSASDLADAREKFGRLSDAIITYMDGLHLNPPDGVRVAYCPTNQKPWMQLGSTLANPYYGSSAPACGSFR